MRKNGRVRAVGTSKVEVNGCEGNVISYDEEKQRYTVELDDGSLLNLRAQNLQKLEDLAESAIPSFEEVLQSYLRQAEVFRSAKPWGIIPGPWAMVCKVTSSRSRHTVERLVHLIGVSDKLMRGLAIYSSIDDYNAQRIDRCLTLQYITPAESTKENLDMFKELGFNYKKNKPRCPNLLLPKGLPPTHHDLVFLEAALPALAKFITYGHEHRNEGVQLLRSVGFSSIKSASLQNEFPCLQSIEINCESPKMVTAVVKTEVMITQTAMAQAQGLGTASFEKNEPIPILPGNTAKCHGCGKLRADLGYPFLRCGGCKQVGYCGKDCQKANWKQHKPNCKK